jgi:hypothetical protein
MIARRTFMTLAAAAASLCAAPAFADPDKDESGNGRGYYKHDRHDRHGDRHHRSEGKEEFWDGNCKVERKWDGGGYKEERKCEGAAHPGHAEGPAPIVVITLPPVVVR